MCFLVHRLRQGKSLSVFNAMEVPNLESLARSEYHNGNASPRSPSSETFFHKVAELRHWRINPTSRYNYGGINCRYRGNVDARSAKAAESDLLLAMPCAGWKGGRASTECKSLVLYVIFAYGASLIERSGRDILPPNDWTPISSYTSTLEPFQ